MGEYAAGPMCPFISDPSVYIHRMLESFACSFRSASWCSLAWSLGALLMLIDKFVGLHHGGFLSPPLIRRYILDRVVLGTPGLKSAFCC